MNMERANTRAQIINAPDHVARTIADNGCPKDAVGPTLHVNLHEPLRCSLQDGAVVVVKLKKTFSKIGDETFHRLPGKKVRGEGNLGNGLAESNRRDSTALRKDTRRLLSEFISLHPSEDKQEKKYLITRHLRYRKVKKYKCNKCETNGLLGYAKMAQSLSPNRKNSKVGLVRLSG